MAQDHEALLAKSRAKNGLSKSALQEDMEAARLQAEEEALAMATHMRRRLLQVRKYRDHNNLWAWLLSVVVVLPFKTAMKTPHENQHE